MITLIIGENSFENERILLRVIGSSESSVERFDGSVMRLSQLPDILMGATLFANKRLVVVKNLSENKSVWDAFGTWLARVSDDIHLVLVEAKADKRTKTYKSLQKIAEIHESTLWTERDTTKAEQWATSEAKRLGFVLDGTSARLLVERVGLDQWSLSHALEKLEVCDEVTPAVVRDVIEARPYENVFQLFEAALKKDDKKVAKMCRILQLSEDPYRVFGLISGQAFQLATLSVANKSAGDVAKDLAAHPFVLSKLAPYVKKLRPGDIREMMRSFTAADHEMKTSASDPWLLIENALLKVAYIK